MAQRIIKVRVTTKSNKEKFFAHPRVSDFFHAYVKPDAKGGQANIRLRELVADFCACPISHVKIISGQTRPVKKVTIETDEML